MELHAKFSPSQMSRVIQCPGSWIEHQVRDPQPPGPAAERGTKLHAYVVRAYKDKSRVLEIKEEEDRLQVLQCLAYLENLESQCGRVHGVELERKVTLDKWGLPDIWGTSDVVVTDHAAKTVHVIDWKFGSGVKVDAYRNAQGMCYMLGAAAEYDYEYFHFHVVQPAISHFDSYEIERKELLAYGEDVLKLAVVRAYEDEPEYWPSTSACQWCIAAVDCKARYELSCKVADQVFNLKGKGQSVDAEQVASLLKDADKVIQHLNKIKTWAYGTLKMGKSVPGYKLISGKRGNRKSIDDDKTVGYLTAKGIDPSKIFDVKLKSPAALEKIDKKLKKDEEFNKLFAFGPTSLKVVPDDHPKAAWSPVHAACSAFSDLIQKEEEE